VSVGLLTAVFLYNETGLAFPENNALMAQLHTRLLVTKRKDIVRLGQKGEGEDGFGRPFEWWSRELCTLIEAWYERLDYCRALIR
jgi:hypothetical protein